jgi:hypothetical protein
MFEMIKELRDKLDHFITVTFPAHADNEEATFKELGTPEEIRHRREWIDAAVQQQKERGDFYKRLTFELTKWGLFGFLGWAAYALWQAFLQGPHK